MDDENIGLNPVLKRGLIYGAIVGTVLVLSQIVVPIYVDPVLILTIFLIVVGIVSYKFVGVPKYGLVMGIITWLMSELLGNALFGFPPFSELILLPEFPEFASLIIMTLAIRVLGFPLAGFVGGYVCQKRGVASVVSQRNAPLTDLESKVLEYIETHNNQIQIVDCALDLGIDSNSVKRALKSLEKKGRVQT
jgi:hypothetical protein